MPYTSRGTFWNSWTQFSVLTTLNLDFLCTSPSPTLRPNSASSVVSTLQGKIAVQAPIAKGPRGAQWTRTWGSKPLRGCHRTYHIMLYFLLSIFPLLSLLPNNGLYHSAGNSLSLYAIANLIWTHNVYGRVGILGIYFFPFFNWFETGTEAVFSNFDC